MNVNEDRARTAITEHASEWFVTTEEGPLDARDSAALAEWFRSSPAHIEEFLGVSAIARDLMAAGTDSEYSLEAILARARSEDQSTVSVVRGGYARRWFMGAMATAACALLALGVFLMWNERRAEHRSAPDVVMTLHFETAHGRQLTRLLADHTVLHLNTDSAVDIRYDESERRVVLRSGQAAFEVAHESDRPFRVIAGPMQAVDLGTQFDVRLEQYAAVVTVVEGRVAVRPSSSAQGQLPIPLKAGQQIRVSEGEWPIEPIAVDAQRATAWLRREIVFDHEPLENVAAEYNRYSSKPIEIATPALRGLQISGVFTTDDTDTFVAFLRSLKSVRVDVTATRIRVSRN